MLLLVGPVLDQAFLSDQRHWAGYVPCGRPLVFRRRYWLAVREAMGALRLPYGRGGLGMLLAGHAGKLYSP